MSKLEGTMHLEQKTDEFKKKSFFTRLRYACRNFWHALFSSDQKTVGTYFETLFDEQEAWLGSDVKILMSNILKLKDLTVSDIMIPRANIVGVEATTSIEDLMQTFIHKSHSRIPVYRETLDDVIGMVHIRDILPWWHGEDDFALIDHLREVLFISPSMRILDLLVQMRHLRLHMALIVDEFGGVDGLVTIEDLIEEIVGEIEDEHDDGDNLLFEKVTENTYITDARLEVENFEEEVGTFVGEEAEDVETLGGLVYAVVGRIPGRGEIISHPAGLEFEVLDADPRRIKRLRVHLSSEFLENHQNEEE